MIRLTLAGILLLPAFTFADTILLGDAKNGGKLHSQSCTACHDGSVYTRKNRKVGTINGLEKRVAMCSTNLNTNHSEDQNSDIVKFLNDSYYKFK